MVEKKRNPAGLHLFAVNVDNNVSTDSSLKILIYAEGRLDFFKRCSKGDGFFLTS